MTTARLTEADIQLRDAITQHLERDSEVDASMVGVTAKSGTVTLTGYVNSCSVKLAAERAVKQIRGVRAVANDIKVRQTLKRTDPDIAADVVKALDLYSTTPDRVQAVVHNSHVTLTGRVAWMFQKRDAEKVARHVRGVCGVMNYIAVTPSGIATRRPRDYRRRAGSERHHQPLGHHGDGLGRHGDAERHRAHVAPARVRRDQRRRMRRASAAWTTRSSSSARTCRFATRWTPSRRNCNATDPSSLAGSPVMTEGLWTPAHRFWGFRLPSPVHRRGRRHLAMTWTLSSGSKTPAAPRSSSTRCSRNRSPRHSGRIAHRCLRVSVCRAVAVFPAVATTRSRRTGMPSTSPGSSERPHPGDRVAERDPENRG